MTRGLQAIEISHRTARKALREQLAAQQRAPEALATALVAGAEEHLVLSTCGRFELYVYGPFCTRDAWLSRLTTATGLSATALWPALQLHVEAAAVAHLFRVAAGLESPILGEDHVLGQVRAAYRAACRAQTAGPTLRRLFDRAIRVGRRVRRETAIGHAARSYAARALEQVVRMTPHRARVAILGTGTIAHEIARALRPHAASLTVVSRHTERAAQLAAAVAGTAAPYADLPVVARQLDAIITCTAATTPVLRAAMLPAVPRHLLVVDLGLPRNVAPDVATRGNTTVLDLESLTGEPEVPHPTLHAADTIVQQEAAAFPLPAWRPSPPLEERVA